MNPSDSVPDDRGRPMHPVARERGLMMQENRPL